MAAKILKYAAIPAAAVVGLGSLRIYYISENKNEELISPRELSIYSPDVPAVQFVDEQPGVVQTGLGSVRVGLQPYVRAVQSGFASVKVGVISVFQAGQDTYHFLRDPPPGFLPRVGVISVSGLGGLILARKGSRLKKIVVPLGLATAGTAVCYPTQTVGALKITGKKVYTVSSSIASVFKSKPKEDVVMSAVSVQSAAVVTSPNTESPTKALSEHPPEPPAVPEEDVTPLSEVVPSVELTPVADIAVEPPSVVDVASEITAQPSEPETVPEPVPDAESTPEPPSEPETVKESSPEPVVETAPEAPSADSVIDTAPDSVPEIVPEAAPEPVVITEEATPPTTSTMEEATPPAVVLSEDASPAIVDEEPATLATPPAEETVPLTPSPTEATQTTADETPPSSAAPLAEPTTVKSRFVPDPSLLDHGQSNPEDADMYSTRS